MLFGSITHRDAPALRENLALSCNMRVSYNFNRVAIPDKLEISNDPLAFDPKQMRAAFDAGRALAKREQPWSTEPDNVGDLPPWAFDAIKALLNRAPPSFVPELNVKVTPDTAM